VDVMVGNLCHQALEFGHLEVLKFAREQGCAWDAFTCACAALGRKALFMCFLRLVHSL